MKILELNAYYDHGSTGKIVKDLCEEGEKQGHEMYAIYWLLRKKEAKNVIFCGEYNEPSQSVKICQWILAGGRLNYNSKRTETIIGQIKRIKPDLIHIHNLHGDFEYGSIDIEMFFKALSDYDGKVIWTFHDCWPITGRCYHFSYTNCNKWKIGCGKCVQRLYDREGVLWDYTKENWEKKKELYNNIQELVVVTVSRWLHDVVSESMLKNREIITIYNGIDTDIFRPRPQEYGKKNKKFTILCIGWDRRKGYKDYFKLAKVLHKDERMIVVGKRPFFRRFSRLHANMHEIDRASSKEEMASIYRSADVYFNSSPAETFGLTTVESMSCGTPVIGYNNTATTELIEQVGGSNKLVDNGSIKGVRDAIDEIRKSVIRAEESHTQCELLFSRGQMLDKYMVLYQEIGL